MMDVMGVKMMVNEWRWMNNGGINGKWWWSNGSDDAGADRIMVAVKVIMVTYSKETMYPTF